MPPSRPRASSRSRASACGPRGGRPYPWRILRRGACTFMDAADDGTIGEHIVVVVVPLARESRGGRALENEPGSFVVEVGDRFGGWGKLRNDPSFELIEEVVAQ